MINFQPNPLTDSQLMAFTESHQRLTGLRAKYPTLHSLTTPHKETLMVIAAGILCIPVTAYCVANPVDGRVFLAQVRNDLKASRQHSSKPWEILHECTKLMMLIDRLRAETAEEQMVLEEKFKLILPHQRVSTMEWGIYKTLIEAATMTVMARRRTYPREDMNRMATIFSDLCEEWLAHAHPYLTEYLYSKDLMFSYASGELDYQDDYVGRIKFPDPKF